MRLIDVLERELARIGSPRPSGGPEQEAYLAGCAAAVREVIDRLGDGGDPLAAVAAIARRPAAAPASAAHGEWNAGRTDALRLIAQRIRTADRSPIDWANMR